MAIGEYRNVNNAEQLLCFAGKHVGSRQDNKQMRLLVLWLGAVFGEILPLTILYEKMENSYEHRLNTVLLQEATRQYNDLLKEAGIEIRLDEFYDYTEYSQKSEYSRLADIAGKRGIEGRMDALQPLQKNIIVLIESVGDGDPEYFSQIDPCRTRFFLDMGESTGAAPAALNGLRRWLSMMMNTEMPDAFVVSGKMPLPRHLSTASLKQEIKHCRSMQRDDEQADSLRKRPDFEDEASTGAVSRKFYGGRLGRTPPAEPSRAVDSFARDSPPVLTRQYFGLSADEDEHKPSSVEAKKPSQDGGTRRAIDDPKGEAGSQAGAVENAPSAPNASYRNNIYPSNIYFRRFGR